MPENVQMATDAQLAALRAKLAGNAAERTDREISQHSQPRQPGIVTVRTAATRCDLKPATIRKWLQRGKLTAHGHDQSGQAL